MLYVLLGIFRNPNQRPNKLMSLPKNSEDTIMNPKKTEKNKFLMDNARTVKLIWITKLVIWSNIIPNKTQFLCPAIQFSPIAVLVVFVSPQLQMATKMLSEYHKYLTADLVVATWVWLGSTHFFAYCSYDDQAFFPAYASWMPFSYRWFRAFNACGHPGAK